MQIKINQITNLIKILAAVFLTINSSISSAQIAVSGYEDTLLIREESSEWIFAPDSTQKYTIVGINVYGNKKTKEKIILRELEFKEGDTTSKANLEELIGKSRQNLLKTSLFNYVTITTEESVLDYSIFVNIKVEERWYLWPQVNITPHNGNLNDWLRDPDISKIDYCFGLKKYNFRGMKESVYMNFRRGFNNITQIGYSDISLDHKRMHMLGLSVSVLKRKSCVLRNFDNKADYVEFDGEKNSFKEYSGQLQYTYRPNINTRNILTLNYSDTRVYDSVAILNPDYLGNGQNRIRAVNLNYLLRIDNRSSVYYPLEGSFVELKLGKNGIFSDDINTVFAKLDARFYTEVLPRFYFSTQAYLYTSSKSTPFYYMETFGTKPNVMAGYEERQIAGKSIAYIKTSYKLELIKQHIWHLKKINIPKFNKIHYALYLNCFANCGYATAKDSDRADKNLMNDDFLGALGIGLDLVTYYDRMFSIYYTKNRQGDAYWGIGIKTSF